MTSIVEKIGLNKQKEFMRCGKQLNTTEEKNKLLYMDLIAEELSELTEALQTKNFQPNSLNTGSLKPTNDELDAMADILVVCLGYYVIGAIPDLISQDAEVLDLIYQQSLSKMPVKDSFHSNSLMLLDTLNYLETLSLLIKDSIKNETYTIDKFKDTIPHIVLSVIMLFKCYNLNVEEVMDEVFNSNMSKFLTCPKTGQKIVLLREDGKIMKGENFTSPDLSKFIDD
jgi:NTP pyrophosphatase (non-canonical NTP hydrolase)